MKFFHSLILMSCLGIVTCMGCATHAHQLTGVRNDFYDGRIDKSSQRVEQLLSSKTKDADALKLDRAIIELTSGEPHKAEQTLRGVRDRLDYLEQKDATEQILSMVKDDQSVAWAGDDYEKVLLRTYLTMANLLNGGDDATAYALQIDEKQDEIVSRLENNREDSAEQLDFKRVALGPYLHAAMLEEGHSDYDDIERSRLKVVSWETTFRDGKTDLERARHGRHSEPGNGVAYLFCMVGRGPHKVEAAEVPTQAAMLVADRILSQVLKQELTPTLAPIKVPIVVPGRSIISNVAVETDGEQLGETATITDVSEFAVQQKEANMPEILGRAVVRRALKKAAMYSVKENVSAHKSPGADIALTLAGIAWEATENADTRCWGLLPDQIQVLRVELPVGDHELQLNPLLAGKETGVSQTVNVRIEDGRNTYIMATIPDREFVGEIVTSSRE
ncbi:hypothetical protein N9153_00950 [Planctomicrobium sp.]|nr:hypothetical protein [Planctomicrobium sp.]